jgi:ribosomal protein S16
MRLKSIGHKNNKSYQIVITLKKYGYSTKYIEKIGLILHLKYNSKRKDRIILINTAKLKYWLSKKNLKIANFLIFFLFFYKFQKGQGKNLIKYEEINQN